MKKLLLLLLISSASFAKINIIVSITPQKTFVDKIGGEQINTTVMVKAGASPHNYEPKALQMKKITQAQLYFSMGVEFETVWLEKFKHQNKNLNIINMTQDINHSITLKHHHETELDPHVWVDPINVKKIAITICNTLSKIDVNNTLYYKNNLKNYLKELDKLNDDIKSILKDLPKDSIFMVFHPAWGYFAKRYNLEQMPVEVAGKEPKMRELIQLMKKAKSLKIKAIFTQPEFSDKSASLIAKNLNIKVVRASPLASDWAENLKMLAKAIAGK